MKRAESPPMSNLFNFGLFQTGWFACVLGAAHDQAVLGCALTIGLILGHLWLVRDRKSELQLMAKGLAIGLTVDTAMVQLGLITFAAPGPLTAVAPIWMGLLWVLLMTTINHSMSWMKSRLWIASMLGAVSGPLSYFAGARLGAAEILAPLAFVLVMGGTWAILTPLLFRLSNTPR